MVKKINGVLIFDKDKFLKFIDNKKFLPNSFTAFKNKIGLANEQRKYLAQSKEIVLVWPYKDCILEGGQQKPEEKRKEIFHNVILAPDEIDRLLEPKAFTNFKRVNNSGEHQINGFQREEQTNRARSLPINTITENLLIKGNNLLVLHSLLNIFRGKVKLIYIDPPYNTGTDEFQYNDNFKHSTWLTFMKNRLEPAKQFLKEDGVIAISCDDNEQAYLKILADEIFGRDNFVATLVRKARKGGGSMSKHVSVDHDYVLIFAKNKSALPEVFIPYSENYLKRYKNKDNKGRFFWDTFVRNRQGSSNFYEIEMPDGTKIKDAWIWPKEKFLYAKKEGEIRFKKNKDGSWSIQVKQRLNEKGQRLRSILEDCPNQKGTETIKNIFGKAVFAYPKPENLIKILLDAFTEKKDIFMDFFVGSGTSIAAAHKMGRQYIGIEQMDYIKTITIERMKKVIKGDPEGISKEVDWEGGNDLIYMELLDLNESFVQRIKEEKTTKGLLTIWEEMKQKGFLSYRIDTKLFEKNIEGFKKLSIEDQKKILLEAIEYNDLYVNYSEIEDAFYNISSLDKKLNRDFYEGNQDA